MPSLLKKKETQHPLSPDRVKTLNRTLRASVVGLPDLDVSRLDPPEQHELAALQRAISVGLEGSSRDPRNLSAKELERWEGLVTKAAGVSGSHFEDARREADGRRKLRELADRARLARPRTKLEQAGCVAIPHALTKAVADRVLDATDLLVVYRVLAADAGVVGPRDTVDDSAG